MYLELLKDWSPFRIDALGLVTIVGVSDVDRAVGRLVKSRIAEWTPLLGAYAIANDQITQPIPGFALYNISDGILATDLAGWFARWLLGQNLTNTSTTITATIDTSKPRSDSTQRAATAIISLSLMSSIVIVTSFMGDWWGFANGLSMMASVLIRKFVLGQNRLAIDISLDDIPENDEVVKIFLTLPTGKAVTVVAPRRVVMDCFLTTPRPPRPRLYNAVRALGWIAFACHIICLGMASLFCQMLSVALLIVSTVIVARRIFDHESRIGKRLVLKCSTVHGKDFRAAAYARLKLTEKEENSMLQWNLFPHKTNKHWWTRYEECQKEGLQSFQTWNTRLATKV